MELHDGESVRVFKEGVVSHITINRPSQLNALNPEILQALSLRLGILSKNTVVRALVISGEGEKAFVAGADIKSMADLGPRPIADYITLGQRVMRQIESLRFPVIAAVHGYALGGGLELALACDLIIAAENTKLGQPEVGLGIIPGFGGTQRLLYRCGLSTTRRLVYMGEMIDTTEALRLGLVDKVVPREQLIESALNWAGIISKKAPLAISTAKRVINQAQEQALLSGLQHEVEGFLELFGTVDREEGMQAFQQKREAKFIGK